MALTPSLALADLRPMPSGPPLIATPPLIIQDAPFGSTLGVDHGSDRWLTGHTRSLATVIRPQLACLKREALDAYSSEAPETSCELSFYR